MTLQEKIIALTDRLATGGYQSLWTFVERHFDEDDLDNILDICDEE